MVFHQYLWIDQFVWGGVLCEPRTSWPAAMDGNVIPKYTCKILGWVKVARACQYGDFMFWGRLAAP